MQIDAVIAWVDGADPAHRAARAEHRGLIDDGGDGRFVETGEIYFALASVLKYAPFIRRIFIVTDNQRPANLDTFVRVGLCEDNRITVVDHDTIFRDLPAPRPNFSSRSIEACLHRIPNLSEHFVYLNDDMGFNRPCAMQDLFDEAGRPRLSGEMRPLSDRRIATRVKTALRALLNRPDTRPSHQGAQEFSAQLIGRSGRFLRVPHRPHPLRISTIERILAAHPGLLERQVGFRFRDRDQYLPVSLAHHAEMADGVQPTERQTVAYLRDTSGTGFARALADITFGRLPFYCVQGLESMAAAKRLHVLTTLENKFADFLPHGLTFSDARA